RDRNVTGVQTCALPISRRSFSFSVLQDGRCEAFGDNSHAGFIEVRADGKGNRLIADTRSIRKRLAPRAVLVLIVSRERDWNGIKIGRASCRERGESVMW